MIHMLSLHVSQQERLWKLSQIETNQAKMPKNHRDLISLNPVPQIIIKKKKPQNQEACYWNDRKNLFKINCQ